MEEDNKQTKRALVERVSKIETNVSQYQQATTETLSQLTEQQATMTQSQGRMEAMLAMALGLKENQPSAEEPKTTQTLSKDRTPTRNKRKKMEPTPPWPKIINDDNSFSVL